MVVMGKATNLSDTVLPFRCTHTTCRDWYPISMFQRSSSCRFSLLRFLLLLMSSRISGSRFPFLSLALRRRAWRAVREGAAEEVGGDGKEGSLHSLHLPTFRLNTVSLPSQALGAHVWNSVRLGQGSPPNSGGATTERTRFCRPSPQVLEHVVHGMNSDTTQSWGQGIKQACSCRGLGSKYSQMAWSAAEPSALSIQFTSRVWMPSSPCRQTPVRPVRSEMGTHWFHAPSRQSYRSLCQSQTQKQLCWLAGRVDWRQLVWRVVQPSTWAHHTARLWLPPGPHSLPIHLPHGPGKKHQLVPEKTHHNDAD